jgi:hypothetical protein
MEEPSEYIDFMAKYKDWISIKRMGIYGDTRPEEVVFHMALIRSTIDNKAFELLGIKTDVLDTAAGVVTAGKKSGYSSLAEAISALDSPDTKKAIAEACGEKGDLSPVAKIYLLGKVLNNLNFDSGINQKVLSKIYPDLKIKKPMGRFGSKKKAAESD